MRGRVAQHAQAGVGAPGFLTLGRSPRYRQGLETPDYKPIAGPVAWQPSGMFRRAMPRVGAASRAPSSDLVGSVPLCRASQMGVS